MANYATLKAAVADVVKTNGAQEITGANLQAVLLSIINSIGANYTFAGVATPSTSIGTPDQNVFYLTGSGTFSNMGDTAIIPDGAIGIFRYNGAWSVESITLAGIDDVVLNTYYLTKSGGTQVGSTFSLLADVDIAANEVFTITVDSGGVDAFVTVDNATYGRIPNCANIYIEHTDGTTTSRYISAYGEQYKLHVAPTKAVKRIRITKGGDTIANATTVTMKIEKLDRMMSYYDVADEVDCMVTGQSKSVYSSVNKGQGNFQMFVPVNIPAGVVATIKLTASDATAVSDNQYNAYFYQHYEDVNTIPAASYRHNYYADGRTYTQSHDIPVELIEVRRASSGVAGNGTLTVEIAYQLLSGDELNKSLVYVNSATGSDTGDGSASSPYATFTKALQATGQDTTIIFEGDTTETLNIGLKPTQKKITLIGKTGKLNRIIKGTKITSLSAVSGETGIYSCPVTSFTQQDNYWIFQHEVADAKTLINDAANPYERSPYQRGKTHRCDSTRIIKAASLAEVRSNLAGSTYSYYYESNTLYLSCPSSDFTNHPIYLPTSAYAIGGNSRSVEVNIVNVECWYGAIVANNCCNSVFKDCAAKFTYGAGAIRYDTATGIQFIGCEACMNTNGTDTGDGFNGHGVIDAVSGLPKVTTCQLVDCWSHDNNDDGYSDHENCETIVRGGLYEYNKKAGCTPASGAQSACYNVVSRHNYRGFYYVNASQDAGVYGQALFYGCVAEDNSIAGFAVAGTGNQVECIDCKSLNNPVGYHLTNRTYMRCIDCGSYGDTTKVQNAGTGSVEIINTNTLN